MLVYLNGEYLPREQARISVDDRGFLFGDGVYEVIRVSNGILFEAAPHLRRLERGLKGLGIEGSDGMDADTVLKIAEHLLRENDLQEGEATVYLQITRGAAPRTHQFPADGTQPTVYASTAKFSPPPKLREQGAAAITSPDIRWTRCDLKTVNLLPNVLAKQAAFNAGVTEAIFIRDGMVTEGASTNTFGVLDGEMRTYPRCNYILPGITREVIFQLADQHRISFSETPILVEELHHVDELFITGTTTDVLPIVRLDGRMIGKGVPGPITRTLQEALAVRISGTLESAPR